MKNARGLTALAENRTSLSLHSQKFRFVEAHQSRAFHLQAGQPASDAHSRNEHRQVFASYFLNKTIKNKSALFFLISRNVFSTNFRYVIT